MTLARFAAVTHVIALLLLGTLALSRPRAIEARAALAALEGDDAAVRDRLGPIPTIESEVKRLEARWQDERTFLPVPELATEERLIKQLANACNIAQVQLDEIAMPNFAKAPAKDHAGLEEVAVGARLEGTYESLVQLVTALESSPYWMEVAEFSISRPDGPPRAGGVLRATLRVVTYGAPTR